MEENGVAKVVANEDIEKSVSIDVYKVRSGVEANVADPEGIGGGTAREVRGGRGAGVVEENSVAEVVANEGIEITVAIDIYKVRSGVAANICKPEGGGGGNAREVWSGRGAGVVEENGSSEVVANEGIEITVAIDVYKVRSDVVGSICKPEGIDR